MKIVYICFTFLSLLGCDLETSPAPIKVNINDRVELNEQMIKVNDRQHNTLYFGFDLRSTLQEDARQYLPFLRYLESSTGYRFKLRFTTKNSTIMEELGTNHVQFAAMGAMSYLKAKEKFNVTTIVQGINLQGQNKYRSFLVVKTDSSIKNLTDIKGKRMAFGDKSSTQGHLIPRIILSQQGLRLSDLAAYIYTGSHQHCAEVVLSGEYDICGMQDTLAETMEKQGLLRILYRSPYFPGSGIAANDQVPIEVIKVVKQALLDFQPLGKDKDKLYHWDKTEMPLGFSPAKPDGYTNLKQWAIQLGFLEAIAEAQEE